MTTPADGVGDVDAATPDEEAHGSGPRHVAAPLPGTGVLVAANDSNACCGLRQVMGVYADWRAKPECNVSGVRE